MIKSNEFKAKAMDLIEDLETLVDKMPDKGLKCSDSQKVCLTIVINDLERTVNGVEDEDMEEGIYLQVVKICNILGLQNLLKRI